MSGDIKILSGFLLVCSLLSIISCSEDAGNSKDDAGVATDVGRPGGSGGMGGSASGGRDAAAPSDTSTPCANVKYSCKREAWVCSEYSGTAADADAEEQSCTKAGGAFRAAPCDRTGTVGGCTFPGAICRNSWWYPPSTTVLVQMTTCGRTSFLPP